MATSTTKMDGLRIVVTAHRFGWSDVAEVREELIRQVRVPGAVVRFDLSQMPEDGANGLWFSALVRVNRHARRAGSTLVVVGAPDGLSSMLDRLWVTVAGR
jgi:hypothetical protein